MTVVLKLIRTWTNDEQLSSLVIFLRQHQQKPKHHQQQQQQVVKVIRQKGRIAAARGR